ncbi:MAG: beta-galactosidase, partial [Armatimonadota bacterium]
MLHHNRMKLKNIVTVIICVFIIFTTSMISNAKTSFNEPPVGWCTFYPGVDVGSDMIGKSGASMLSVTQSGWGIESIEGKLDFNPMDLQLKLASENNLKLALISETNPVYSPAWLNDKAKAAGENTIGSGGQDGGVPTFSSPIFKKAQEDLIKGVIDHVKQVDKDRVIQYYHSGCEWWFPHRYRYNELEINHFRGWLQKKYGTVSKLNQRWVSKFPSFSVVPAPKIDSIQAAPEEMGKMISSDMGEEHCSWSIGGSTGADTDKKMLAIVEPGKLYELSAWIKTSNLKGAGAFLEIAWIAPQGGGPTS